MDFVPSSDNVKQGSDSRMDVDYIGGGGGGIMG
jgi:hypothetical protein